MTQLLEEVIAKIHKLPATEQDAIAALIMDELGDEKKWDKTFADSQDKLAKLANKARQDIKAGKVKKMGFNDL